MENPCCCTVAMLDANSMANLSILIGLGVCIAIAFGVVTVMRNLRK